MEGTKDPVFEIKHSEKFGRCLVAKRPLKAGDRILKEYPLVVFPTVPKICYNEGTQRITCLSCYDVVDSLNVVDCANCGWSFCCWSCSKDSYHRQLECDVFQKNKISYSRERACLLCYVRCLRIKEIDPDKWNQLMNLAFSGSEDSHFDEWSPDAAEIFLKSCKIHFSQAELKTLRNIIRINNYTFGVDNASKDKSSCRDRKKLYRALYSQASLFTHSCAPNLSYRKLEQQQQDRWTIEFFSLVDIKEGEILTFAYIEDITLLGTHQRRISIFKSLGFRCECSRCNDPTELGSYYSAVKCSKCSEGWLLPLHHAFERLSGCSVCRFTLTKEEVQRVEETFQRKLNAVNLKTGRSQRKLLVELIKEATSKYNLHHNHNLVIDATQKWLFSCDLNLLLNLPDPESEVLFNSIDKLATKVLAIRQSFGTLSQQVKLEALIAAANARLQYKSSSSLSIVQNEDSSESKLEKVKSIAEYLRSRFRQEDEETQHCNPEVPSSVRDLEEKH